jgi:hypothetical protein
MKLVDNDRYDNLQRLLDPCCPMDLFYSDLRYDWLHTSVRFWKCDVAF